MAAQEAAQVTTAAGRPLPSIVHAESPAQITNVTARGPQGPIGPAGPSWEADSFEAVAANLDASDAVFTYASGDLSAITYANGVVKSLAYGIDGLASVTLSGAVPSGINLVKSLQYTGGELTAIIYS